MAPVRYLPSWFPGASFHKIAKDGHRALEEMVNKPYETVKAQVVSIVDPAEMVKA
jgi:hypothetical protein